MRTVFGVLTAFVLSAVSAQQSILSVTSPLQGTVYTAGSPAVISWVNPTVSVIPQIVLSKGDPSALQQVLIVATNVSASNGSYTWNVPNNVTAEDDYALVFGISPNQSYSPMFTIQAAH